MRVDAAELERALRDAVEVGRAAGALLRDDFHRAGGARGADDKAEADLEAETLIRARLLQAWPGWGYLGEETGAAASRPGRPVFVVDPNDGTRDYLQGRRGSSVSIGVVHEGRPVLGVVFAFAYPDDAGELFTWAEGCGPVRRNGRACETALPARLSALDVVLVSSKGDLQPTAQLRWAAPARFRAVPSIAHRLALLAAGEGALVTSLYAPKAWDFAAGHALVRGAGGVLVDEHGAELRYDAAGHSRARQAYAGAPQVVAAARLAAWRRLDRAQREDVTRASLRRGQALRDAGLLARAQGLLLGQLAGDSLGSLATSASASARASAALSLLGDDETRGTLAGQPSPAGELALVAARALLAHDGFEAERQRAAYVGWRASAPVGWAQGDASDVLLRAGPLALLAHAWDVPRAAALARADAALTHPGPVCGDASAACVIALAHALRAGDGPRAAYEVAWVWAREHAHADVVAALERAQAAPSTGDESVRGAAPAALQSAFFELLQAPDVAAGVRAVTARGGDATSPALAGALLGATFGREALPAQWRRLVLSCRAHPARTPRARPAPCWPTDALELSERLLLAGRRPAATE